MGPGSDWRRGRGVREGRAAASEARKCVEAGTFSIYYESSAPLPVNTWSTVGPRTCVFIKHPS